VTISNHTNIGSDAPVPLIASPIHMSRTPPEGRLAPPALGEHTDEVLQELLDLTASEISALRARSVV
jgi:crotonobetainyl-CoA:carnitine CoA-transferase CaiB-like acyl-CoA transferase